MKKFFIFLVILVAIVYGLNLVFNKRPLSGIKSNIVMQITTPSFANNGSIPKMFTCEGQNINPQLEFSRVPEEAQALALIVDDPDAPNGTFTHWVVYNIPPKTKGIPQGSTNTPGTEAANSAGTKKYLGPCPPSGEHRYYFKLYALNSIIDEGSIANKSELQDAMRGHILEEAELMGRYKKSE